MGQPVHREREIEREFERAESGWERKTLREGEGGR